MEARSIVVNGRTYQWLEEIVTYEQVCFLGGLPEWATAYIKQGSDFRMLRPGSQINLLPGLPFEFKVSKVS